MWEMGGDHSGIVRTYLGVVSDLKSVLKSQFWVSKLQLLTCAFLATLSECVEKKQGIVSDLDV